MATGTGRKRDRYKGEDDSLGRAIRVSEAYFANQDNSNRRREQVGNVGKVRSSRAKVKENNLLRGLTTDDPEELESMLETGFEVDDVDEATKAWRTLSLNRNATPEMLGSMVTGDGGGVDWQVVRNTLGHDNCPDDLLDNALEGRITGGSQDAGSSLYYQTVACGNSNVPDGVAGKIMGGNLREIFAESDRGTSSLGEAAVLHAGNVLRTMRGTSAEDEANIEHELFRRTSVVSDGGDDSYPDSSATIMRDQAGDILQEWMQNPELTPATQDSIITRVRDMQDLNSDEKDDIYDSAGGEGPTFDRRRIWNDAANTLLTRTDDPGLLEFAARNGVCESTVRANRNTGPGTISNLDTREQLRNLGEWDSKYWR